MPKYPDKLRRASGGKPKLRARRSLSQNFLIDGAIADRMASALPVKPGERIYEIGAGKGFLTERLVAMGAECRIVEKDRRMVGMLHKKFKRTSTVTIFHADVLSLPPEAEPPAESWLYGNLPFGIGHRILQWAVARSGCWRGAVVTLQREVVRRLLAQPGDPGRGSVSVWFQAHASGVRLFDIPPRAFYPPPRVTSTVMSIDFKPETPELAGLEGIDFIVQIAFAQPRKILANNFAHDSRIPAETLNRLRKDCPDLLAKRAQELETADFARLAHVLRAHQDVA
ncbi:MAG TPA: 16S rRNA (adenine(1518)-N(6)/adenine(1519)-N(6))-dimethyltransferase RsmA [candidate division Zixibacteria bacterium]|jgi:16S rRNA (adenine1518-N6/adenine1519-N6)-dimethyltransferase